MGILCTTCKNPFARKKEITVQIYFGPFAPGICDDCADVMAKALMDSKGFLPHSNIFTCDLQEALDKRKEKDDD